MTENLEKPIAAQNLASNLTRLRRALQNSHVFAEVSEQLIDDLVNNMDISVIAGGQQVFKQGDAADSLLIVVSGRLLATRKRQDGTTERLGEIEPGESVGEVGLILQQSRAANVIAIRDTTVASLHRGQFEQQLKRHPIELNRAFSQTIFNYSQPQKQRKNTTSATTFAVIPLLESVQIDNLCNDILNALETFGKCEKISPHQGEQLHPKEGASNLSSAKLCDLEQQFDYLVYQASNAPTPWSYLAARQADKLVLVAHYTTSPETVQQAREFIESLTESMAQKHLVLLHPDGIEMPLVNIHWRQQFELEWIYPIRHNHSADIFRLARFITDNAVGLVLGGGGARGLAHIGVLKALHECAIPIDIVGGNSMGALIGAQYLAGTPIDELLASTKSFVRGGESLTIPLFSLLSGQRVRKDLKQMFGNKTVEGLWRPFFAVSCNLSDATIKMHDSGTLWRAVLASNSPAGILPPVVSQGNLLVDAALLDNVPVRSMRQKLKIGTIIAIDVDVSNEMTVDSKVKYITGWQVLWQRLFGRNQERLPGIIDVLNRSGHLGGLANRATSIAMADHYLQPPVAKFTLMGYSKGQEIVDTGYHYTMARIKQWQQQQSSKNDEKPTT